MPLLSSWLDSSTPGVQSVATTADDSVPIKAVTTDEYVALKVKLEEKVVNATLDSGAGLSVVDMGTVEILGLQHLITKCEDKLVNASGEKMDIAGVVDIQVKVQGAKPVKHTF